jgi:hypothetical protein
MVRRKELQERERQRQGEEQEREESTRRERGSREAAAAMTATDKEKEKEGESGRFGQQFARVFFPHLYGERLVRFLESLIVHYLQGVTD